MKRAVTIALLGLMGAVMVSPAGTNAMRLVHGLGGVFGGGQPGLVDGQGAFH